MTKPDPTPCDERAMRGAEIIEAYPVKTGRTATIEGIIRDLKHYCDSTGLCFADALDWADHHYQEDRTNHGAASTKLKL